MFCVQRFVPTRHGSLVLLRLRPRGATHLGAPHVAAVHRELNRPTTAAAATTTAAAAQPHPELLQIRIRIRIRDPESESGPAVRRCHRRVLYSERAAPVQVGAARRAVPPLFRAWTRDCGQRDRAISL